MNYLKQHWSKAPDKVGKGIQNILGDLKNKWLMHREKVETVLTTCAYHKAHTLSGTAGQKQDSTASQK